MRLALAGAVALPVCSRAAEGDDMTAVSSRTSDDYVRAKMADGSFRPEFYAFGEGGHLTAISDATVDRLGFMELARTVAGALQVQNYLPTKDPRATKLLVMVYWGLTGRAQRTQDSLAAQRLQDASAASAAADRETNRMAEMASGGLYPSGVMPCAKFDPDFTVSQVDGQAVADSQFSSAMAVVAAEDQNRNSATARTAALLGYDSLWNSTMGYVGTPLEYRRQDMLNELEEGRYFVILMAYDFQQMWKHKQHKLLWETRISIRQRNHEFDRDLVAMTRYASAYFGQDSHGLVKREIPAGRVNIGEVKVVDAGTAK